MRLFTSTHKLWPLAVALATTAVNAQPSATPDSALDEAEPARRYAVEILLFRYGSSVSAGTEIFVPDELPISEVPTFGDGRGLAVEGRAPLPAGESASVPRFGDRELPANEPQEPDASALLDVEPEVLSELPTSSSIELSVLTADELTMNEEYATLSRLDAYQPVLWSGWTQIVLEDALTATVDLRRLGRIPLAYDGELKLYLSRFLHLVVDLELTESAEPADGTVSAEPLGGRNDVQFDRALPRKVSHRIEEDRIVNNGDLRYFDHPKFGLLAKLTLIEDEPIEDTDESVLLPGATAVSPPR